MFSYSLTSTSTESNIFCLLLLIMKNLTGKKLHVLNMSQQSSASDLLGGYKPFQMKHSVRPVRKTFEHLLHETRYEIPDNFIKYMNQYSLKLVDKRCF